MIQGKKTAFTTKEMIKVRNFRNYFQTKTILGLGLYHTVNNDIYGFSSTNAQYLLKHNASKSFFIYKIEDDIFQLELNNLNDLKIEKLTISIINEGLNIILAFFNGKYDREKKLKRILNIIN